MNKYYYESYLQHHGILGQEWGKRNGPPYPLRGGEYSRREKAKIFKERKKKYSIYNKKHFDRVLEKGSKVHTLSYNKDRIKNVDMFYATHTRADQDQYNALFNKKAPQEIYDDKGNSIGTGMYYKYKISSTLADDVKVASEDSGANAFKKLFSEDRDFYNFVTDESRMRKHFVTDKYKFKGYRESRKVLDKIDNPFYRPSEKDLETIYRMFNYVIPSDGAGNARAEKDVTKQRAKFFNELKKEGYAACLDTNDAIYGGFHANDPVIVFDMEMIASVYAKRVSESEKKISSLAFAGRRALGI